MEDEPTLYTFDIGGGADGSYWMLDGMFHREDGPALTTTYGVKQWFIHGVLHREDGPAIEWDNGSKEWWLNGVQYEPIKWLLKLHELKNAA